jgi:acetyl-CoA carboxylase biotin carboxyl carrier protein
MREAARRPERGPVLEVQLDLLDPIAGPDGVDRHPHLHAKSLGEGQQLAQHFQSHRPLARDRRFGAKPAAALDCPAGEAERQSEAPSLPPGERGDGEIALVAFHGIHEADQLTRRRSQVAITQQDRRRLAAGRALNGALGRRFNISPFAPRGFTAHYPGTMLRCDPVGAVGGCIVSDNQLTARQPPCEGIERCANQVRFVMGRNDDYGLPGHGRVLCRPTAMPDIEAHITGTVWKIEVKVGDDVAEGDTVVILESMKMEMPVEAEDDGKVAEIRCEEGQSVSEGDVLVVLE